MVIIQFWIVALTTLSQFSAVSFLSYVGIVVITCYCLLLSDPICLFFLDMSEVLNEEDWKFWSWNHKRMGRRSPSGKYRQDTPDRGVPHFGSSHH